MTILAQVKAALAEGAEAPENMKQLLSVSQDDLSTEELELAKTKFPDAFAVLEQPVEVKTVKVPDEIKTFETKPTTPSLETETEETKDAPAEATVKEAPVSKKK